MTDQQLAELLAQASATFDAMTVDQKLHMRHQQKISFVTGNLALTRGESSYDDLRSRVTEAAGPCPCGDCRSKV